ncbi:MAG: hypothetical protein EBY65_00740 [Acidimicrobiia bacterium]|nr:hypothetical protein [Acidimicrobiia bacterium]
MLRLCSTSGASRVRGCSDASNRSSVARSRPCYWPAPVVGWRRGSSRSTIDVDGGWCYPPQRKETSESGWGNRPRSLLFIFILLLGLLYAWRKGVLKWA